MMIENDSHYPRKAVVEVWKASLVPVRRESKNKLPYIIGKETDIEDCFYEFYYDNTPVYVIETVWRMHKTEVLRRYRSILKLCRIERRKRYDIRGSYRRSERA